MNIMNIMTTAVETHVTMEDVLMGRIVTVVFVMLDTPAQAVIQVYKIWRSNRPDPNSIDTTEILHLEKCD